MDKGKLIKVIVRSLIAVGGIFAAEYAFAPEWAPVHQILLLLGGGQ